MIMGFLRQLSLLGSILALQGMDAFLTPMRRSSSPAVGAATGSLVMRRLATWTPSTPLDPSLISSNDQDDEGGLLSIRKHLELYYAGKVSDQFVASIARSGVPAGDAEKKRAQTFANMAVRALMARGVDVIADDFTYYSEATGYLSKQEFLGLLKVYDMAFPDMLATPIGDFVLTSDGPVAFVAQLQARFTGPLVTGPDEAIEPNGRQLLSDRELTVVSFDSVGRLQSLSTGVVVATGVHDENGSVEEQIAEEERRVQGQEAKLESLKAQKGRAAYEKVEAVLFEMRDRLKELQGGKIQSMSTTEQKGGLEGVLHTVGAGASLSGLVAHLGTVGESLTGMVELEPDEHASMGFVSVPTDCMSVLDQLTHEHGGY